VHGALMMRRPRSRTGWILAAAVAAAGACGGTSETGVDPGITTPFEVTVSLDTGTRHQVMQGFGGAVAFYVNWVSQHPNADQIYQAAFADLGLQMLRIGNWNANGRGGTSAIADTVAVVHGATAAMGHQPLLQMSGWSPPATLKSNNDVMNGGTIAAAADGSYRYADYAAWWMDSLAQHAAAGVVPDYVSIQNEPDFVASGWQSCLFDPVESATRAGYDKALAAVYAALHADGAPVPAPKLLGPETSGIASQRVQGYVSAIKAAGNLGQIDVIAHHLYNGGTGSLPASFNVGLSGLGTLGADDDKPLFMTEYGPTAPDMFSTAWLIHNAVTVEGVSAYLFWPLTWAPPAAGAAPAGLVTTENPFSKTSWKSPNGWIVNDIYYAVRHFSKWIDAGWQRVEAASTADPIKVSAFASPDGTNVTIVLLNTEYVDHEVTVDPGAFAFTTSAVYRTSGSDERTAPIGALAGPLMMPARAMATVTLGP
jgi:glucuronoarabinoxylan endo-1,4-beta-xylanase